MDFLKGLGNVFLFILNMIIWIVFIVFIGALATFFLMMFVPENVLNAINVVKALFG